MPDDPPGDTPADGRTTCRGGLRGGSVDGLFRALQVLALLYVFLVSVQLIGDAFRLLGGGSAATLFAGIDNLLEALMIGLLAAALLQSSSTTTAITVGLVSVGAVSLSMAIPMMMGANVGTAVTALLASMGAEGAGALLGLQIARCHLLFNLLGIGLLYGVPAVRPIPLRLARRLAHRVALQPRLGLVYVGVVFFALPLGALGLYEWLAG